MRTYEGSRKWTSNEDEHLAQTRDYYNFNCEAWKTVSGREVHSGCEQAEEKDTQSHNIETTKLGVSAGCTVEVAVPEPLCYLARGGKIQPQLDDCKVGESLNYERVDPELSG